MKSRIVAVSFLILASVNTSWAKDEVLNFPFPLAPNFANIVGVVFPAAPVAGALNAASMPFFGSSTTIEVANAPTLQGSGGYGTFASAAKTGKNWGLGVGYMGDVSSSVASGGYGGLGFSLNAVSFGFTGIKAPVAGSNFQGNLSIAIPMASKFRFSAIATSLGKSNQLTLGVGYKGDKYLLEVDLRLPPMDNLTTGYTFFGAGSVMLGRINLYASAGYQTVINMSFYTAGVAFAMSKESQIGVQYSDTKRLAIAMMSSF